jgi:hypothetical protein
VACLIRLFLRYIVEVEALTTKGFTKVQSSCYIKTLEVGDIGVSMCFASLGAVLPVLLVLARSVS